MVIVVSRLGDLDPEGIAGQQLVRLLRPFDQRGSRFQKVIQPELFQFFGLFKPVKIEVGQVETREIVGLYEREGRARHFQLRLTGEGPDQRPGERGLPGAKIARQANDIAGLQDHRDVVGKSPRALFVGNFDCLKGARQGLQLVVCHPASYSAAAWSASSGRAGKTQVTVVPLPSAD